MSSNHCKLVLGEAQVRKCVESGNKSAINHFGSRTGEALFGDLIGLAELVEKAKNEGLFPIYWERELDELPEPEYLIDEILQRATIGFTYGPSGSLKTFLVIDEALSLATGVEWGGSADRKINGFEIRRPCRVLVIAGEGASGIKKRIRAI